jgi:hypothetical protein
MTEPQKYFNAAAFRMALETRLKNKADAQDVDVQRLRKQVAFDRLLCRLFQKSNVLWILKGGYAMELRMEVARTTRDIDLSLQGLSAFELGASSNQVIRDLLQTAVAINLQDYFTFLIGEPMMDLEGAPYGGARYPVDARMDGRTFARFHLDVGLGDKALKPLDSVQSKDWLGFANIEPGTFIMISKEQQFAEKYHAYTRPRTDRPNSRVRDLVDMVLLIQSGDMDISMIKTAFSVTFSGRKTHKVPDEVPPPPDNWAGPFKAMAVECQINTDIKSAVVMLTKFVNCLNLVKS